jgi:hypothetical protein
MIIDEYIAIAKRLREIQRQENPPPDDDEIEQLTPEENFYCCTIDYNV